MSQLFFLAVTIAVATLPGAVTVVGADTRQIDVDHSVLTVFVYKSGLFSAFADNHVVRAPIASGMISEDAPGRIDFAIRSADLRVLDPDLSPARRAEVQERMLGPEVLDVARFSEITFMSTSIGRTGTDRWEVKGRLTLHGQTQVITVPIALVNGRYRGEALIKQRDFGIEPIKVAGGTVKVKDELKIQFEIAK